MYCLADYYRHRGLVAQQEAAQTLNEGHLDRREADQQSDEKR